MEEMKGGKDFRGKTGQAGRGLRFDKKSDAFESDKDIDVDVDIDNDIDIDVDKDLEEMKGGKNLGGKTGQAGRDLKFDKKSGAFESDKDVDIDVDIDNDVDIDVDKD